MWLDMQRFSDATMEPRNSPLFNILEQHCKPKVKQLPSLVSNAAAYFGGCLDRRHCYTLLLCYNFGTFSAGVVLHNNTFKDILRKLSDGIIINFVV